MLTCFLKRWQRPLELKLSKAAIVESVGTETWHYDNDENDDDAEYHDDDDGDDDDNGDDCWECRDGDLVSTL